VLGSIEFVVFTQYQRAVLLTAPPHSVGECTQAQSSRDALADTRGCWWTIRTVAPSASAPVCVTPLYDLFSYRETMLHISWKRGKSKTFNRNEIVFVLFCSPSWNLVGVCSLIQFYSFARKELLRWGTWPISAALCTQCNSLAWVHYMACVTSRQVVLLLFLTFMDVPDGGIRFY
jgi:hypothetical protein